MSSITYSRYEQEEEIPRFGMVAQFLKNDNLISNAIAIKNGCCRGLSMKWLQRGCSVAGMRVSDPGFDGLLTMAQASQLQVAGERGDTDVASQLQQLGLPASSAKGLFTEGDKVKNATTFVMGTKGRYFIGIGEPPRGHAIAALYAPPRSKVFDPNVGELNLDDAEFGTWLKVVLKHYVAKGYGNILIYYLGPIPSSASSPPPVPAAVSASSPLVPRPPSTPSPRALAGPGVVSPLVPRPPNTPSPRALAGPGVVSPLSPRPPNTPSPRRRGPFSGK